MDIPAAASASRFAAMRMRLAPLTRHGAWVALFAFCTFAAVRFESFLTAENLTNVLRQNSMAGLLAMGMTFVILSGGIDLSVGALLAVGGVVAAWLSGRGVAIAVPAAMAVAAIIGLGNGLVITKARVPPFIATLVTMLAARGVLLAVTNEQSVQVAGLASGFKWIGRGWIGPVPVPVVILLLAYLLGWAVMAHTRFGRHIYAVGDNDEAARLMGLGVDSVRLGVYTTSGALAGLAGVILAARVGVGQPVAGLGWELNAITAVVLGGTLLSGGQGSITSTLAGVLLLGAIFNVFNQGGTINSYWQWVVRGIFLLAVVVLQGRLALVQGDSHADRDS